MGVFFVSEFISSLFLYLYTIMNRPNQKITVCIVLMFISISGFSQTFGGGGEGPPPPQGSPPPPPGMPIDNGLIVLFAVALIFGIYTILKHSKKSTQA